MAVNFESTLTEADFKQPLLDGAEERLLRDARGDVDLEVEGLGNSLFGRLIQLLGGRGR